MRHSMGFGKKPPLKGKAFGLSMKDLRQVKKGSPSRLQERKMKLGLGKLSCSCKTTNFF